MYGNSHTDFSCVASSSSTTNYWFQEEDISAGTTKELVAATCSKLSKVKSQSGWYWTMIGSTAMKTYCDFSTSPPWVLVESMTAANAKYSTGKMPTLLRNKPSNTQGDNTAEYRMSRTQMLDLIKRSVRWRATCNMDTSMTNDYMVARFNQINPITWDGGGSCQPFEKISLRNTKSHKGGTCSNCNVRVWQSKDTGATASHFHVDSTPSSQSCSNGLRVAKGASSEDNWVCKYFIFVGALLFFDYESFFFLRV